MADEKRPELDLATASGGAVNAAMSRGVVEALQAHRQTGDAVVVWRDGQVVKVLPQAIELPGGPPTLDAREIMVPHDSSYRAAPPAASSR